MIEIGYMLKKAAVKQPWLTNSNVTKISSISECITENFCDFVEHWKHNGYWFFNSPESISALVKELSVETSGMSLLFFEVFEKQFNLKSKQWESFGPEEDFETKVTKPKEKHLLGYDVVSYSHQNMPECSPLSCNQLANKIPVNKYCLLESLEAAQSLLEEGSFENTEPGPFRILAVYSVGKAENSA